MRNEDHKGNRKGSNNCISPFCNFLANTVLIVNGKERGKYCYLHGNLMLDQYPRTQTKLEPFKIPGAAKNEF